MEVGDEILCGLKGARGAPRLHIGQSFLQPPPQLLLEAVFGDDFGWTQQHTIALRRRFDKIADFQFERPPGGWGNGDLVVAGDLGEGGGHGFHSKLVT